MGWTIESTLGKWARCSASSCKIDGKIQDPVRLCKTIPIKGKGRYMADKKYYHIKCTTFTLDEIKQLYGWNENLISIQREWVENQFP